MPLFLSAQRLESNFVAGKRSTSVLREIATTMFLLAILRWVLVFCMRASQFNVLAGRGFRFRKSAHTACQPLAGTQPGMKVRGRTPCSKRGLPREWINAGYLLSEDSQTAKRLVREALEQNHPLGALVRIVRRLAGLPEVCPALVPSTKPSSDRRAQKPRR